MKMTHCALRLGDNLAAVHLLRKFALAYPSEQFLHVCYSMFLPQLAPLVVDVKNIQLRALETVSNPCAIDWQRRPLNPASIDLWKNAAGFWETHALRFDYGQVMVAHAHRVGAQLRLESPVRCTRDLLFDYPALRPESPPCEPFDFLVVNSQPLSNQLPAYDAGQFEELIAMLARKYHIVTTQPCCHAVTCTQDARLSVTQIGQLSQFCKFIVMVATGPAWPTFNIWNFNSIKLRVILSGCESIDLAPNTIHTNKIHAVRDILVSAGLL